MKYKMYLFITSIIIFIGLSVHVIAAPPTGLSSLSYDLKKCIDLSRSSCSTSIYNDDTTFSMNSEGVYDLIVSATDNAGYSKTETFTYYIDTTSPSSVGISGISTIWVQSDTVSITCSDALSGCDTSSYQYKVSSSNFTCGAGGTWITDTQYTTTSNMYICARARDNLGNGYTYSSTYHIDKVDNVDPNYSISYSPTLPTWNNSSTTVSITCIDSLSDCNMYNITDWTVVGNTYSREFTSNISGSIELRDQSSGYNSTMVNYNVTNIEKNQPDVDIDFGSYIAPNWTNSNVTGNVTCSDTVSPNSGCDNTTRSMRIEPTPFTCDSLGGTRLSDTETVSTANNTNKIRYICARAQDNAGNYGYSPVYNINIDKIDPLPTDVSASNGRSQASEHLAGSYTLDYTVGINGGSPIHRIDGRMENFANQTSYLPVFDMGDTLSFNANMTNVDNARITGGLEDGSRRYSVKITRIEDQAGNVTLVTGAEATNPDNTGNTLPKYTYNIYANTNSITTYDVVTNQLENTSNVADGTTKNLTIDLEDTYGNAIVPAGGINRTIDFDFAVTNSLRLDQYNPSTSNSAVFVTTPDGALAANNILTASELFTDEPSTDGTYNYGFDVYTPTYMTGVTDGRELVNGNMTIHDIDYIVNQDIAPYPFINTATHTAEINNSSNIEFVFKPLYTAKFVGDLANKILIEPKQTAEINIDKTPGSLANPSTSSVQIGFGYIDSLSIPAHQIHPSLDFIYDPAGTPVNIPQGHVVNQHSLGTIPSLIGGTSGEFETKVTQARGTYDPADETYVSSHISYTLNGVSVKYNTDILGRDSYFAGTNMINSSQVGLKVLGKIQSKNQQDLTVGQTGTDIYLLGNNSKAALKEKIRKQTVLETKNVQGGTTGGVTDFTGNTWNNAAGERLRKDSVLYFEPTALGSRVNIGDGTDKYIDGVKTIVIKGANAYITSNLYYNSPTDMLGIIVMQDELGNGGNIYIHTDVTNISSTLYADKSIISYNTGFDNGNGDPITQHEIDGSIASPLLNNQLYIYGTLFSENTIGGGIIPKCPYYLVGPCTTNVAKKYDLNFLRRYFVYDEDSDGEEDEPYASGLTASGFTYTDTSPDDGIDDGNFKYPLVIEYNPNIQNIALPLFETDDF